MRFGGVAVLDGLSGRFDAGQVHVVIGANGAGKSTLLRCLLGLERHEGSVEWRGEALRPAEGLAAPVFDRTPFYSRLTGRQNLRVLSPEVMEGPHQYLSNARLDARVATYSHGERKRLALMMAFNSSAEILILDEPSLGLDAPGMREIVTDIRRMVGARTVIVVDHNVEWYRDVADTCSVLAEGSLHQVKLDSDQGGVGLVELRDAIGSSNRR